jgi:DNA-binding MarR family transcriptional regulator
MPRPEKMAPSPRNEDAERLRRLVQTFARRFELLLGDRPPCGQPISTSHAHALTLLLENAGERGGLSQAELGQMLGIDKSNVARLCARMESDAHVKQTRAPGDGRSRLVTLEPQGERMARIVERASRERFARLLDDIPIAKRRVVLDGLAILDQALDVDLME